MSEKTDPQLEQQLDMLREKYNSMGQDMNAYLEGLLLSNYMPYWEYTMVDTLLTLQHPRTDYPDEVIFIIYHQITELYFRLALHEIEQLANNGRKMLDNGHDAGWQDYLTADLLKDRLRRINNYFEVLTKSFSIMEQGMEREQFLKFRMALLPASGFQSAQYRKIEICSTDLKNLVHKDYRVALADVETDDEGLKKLFEHIYWKAGATELESGQKTLTLQQFEDKYSQDLLQLARDYKDKNLWRKYKSLKADEQADPTLISLMKQLDANVNINWPLVHYKTAARYLLHKKGDVAATGGTNWQQYLPPKFMKRIFFPDLWNKDEKVEWGKSWVSGLSQ